FNKEARQSFYYLWATQNHGRLNAYNHRLALGWRANTDIQVYTGTAGVVHYIRKYTSKAEKRTESFREMLSSVTQHLSATSTTPLFSTVVQLLNKTVGVRNISAQEVLHLLHALPLVRTGRVFQNVDCRPESEHSKAYLFSDSRDYEDGDIVTEKRSLLQKYKERPDALSDVTYLDFCLNHTFVHPFKRRGRNTQSRILLYMPQYKRNKDFENYARVRITLNHPFQDVKSLLALDGNTFNTFSEAYRFCKASYIHKLQDNYYTPELNKVAEDEDLEEIFNNKESDSTSFTKLAIIRPGENRELVGYSIAGQREIDLMKNWLHKDHLDQNHLDPLTYWRKMKLNYPVTIDITTDSTRDQLQSNQRLLYNLFVNHFTAIIGSTKPEQLLVNLDREGGTGKTYIIKVYLLPLLQAIYYQFSK
ncbi:hypothetical protein P154DRAFT_425445, partial [Amniculicola lignicola CBS 123094]